MILLIDNYDSFSYNLYQLVGEINSDIRVIRSDGMTVEEIRTLAPERIILSPGPGRPEAAGITVEAAKTLGKEIPTLGVCLGHQAICEAFGGSITYAPELMHGKQCVIHVDNKSRIFQGLSEELEVARYHSLVADQNRIPDDLTVTAVDEKGVVMAVQHKTQPVYGVQFHPESIMTPSGKQMIENFLNIR